MRSVSRAWPEIRAQIRAAGALAVFLDFDGTLAPIAPHPSQARLPAGTRRLLRDLCGQPGIWVAVVSGRALKEVRSMVGVQKVCCVGNHGLELEGPRIRHVNPAARRARPTLRKIVSLLRRQMRSVRGAWVEDKGLTLAVHFRQVQTEQKLLVRNLFHEVVRPFQEKGLIRVTAGKEVLEVRPPVHWTKGSVVSWLLARQEALARKGPLLPFYIGDDLTDEDAFKALEKRGITVVVGSGNSLSRAKIRAASPQEVAEVLSRLLSEWRKRSVAERGADGAGDRDERRASRHIARRA